MSDKNSYMSYRNSLDSDSNNTLGNSSNIHPSRHLPIHFMQAVEAPARIFITEDEILIAREIEMTLQELGYQVVGLASNGSSALAQIAETQPDLVLMDIVLPGAADGIEIAEQVRSHFQVPVVFLTAYTDRSTLERAKVTEPFGYVLKPFQPEELDITIQIALARHRSEQSKLDSLRSSITNALPHEINTPLHSILGFANVVLRHYDSMSKTEILETLQYIQTSAVGLEKICQRFLLHAKLELLATNPVEVVHLTQSSTIDTTEVIDRHAQRKAMELGRSVSLRANFVDLPVQMAELYLGQLVDELLDNALRFSDWSTFVDLRTFAREQTFCLMLIDRGQGMTQCQLDQIGAYQQFNRNLFEQQGLGLGLALVQKIVKLHNGRLVIHSKPGQGTSITVELPMPSISEQV